MQIKYFTIGVWILSSLQMFINWFLSRKYMNLGCDPVIYYRDTTGNRYCATNFLFPAMQKRFLR